MVCHDVQIEPVLQPITGEELANGTNQAPDVRLDVHCRGFWERKRAAFFDIRVCHPNAESYRDLSPKQMVDLSDYVGFALTLTTRLYEKESRVEGSVIFNSSSAKQIFTQKFGSPGFQIEHKINSKAEVPSRGIQSKIHLKSKR